MKEKILYIYGYGSNPNDSFTMKELKPVIDELGYELISIEYDQENPDNGINELEKYIRDNKIKYIIGHSLGGFIALCINENVKKIVINPCLKPHFELPKIGDISIKTLYDYEYLESWLLLSAKDTPWISPLYARSFRSVSNSFPNNSLVVSIDSTIPSSLTTSFLCSVKETPFPNKYVHL